MKPNPYDLRTHTPSGPLHPCCKQRVGFIHLPGCPKVKSERTAKEVRR